MRCRIDLTDRMNRLLVGVLLAVGFITGYGLQMKIIVASIEFIEGVFGYCFLSCMLIPMKRLFGFK